MMPPIACTPKASNASSKPDIEKEGRKERKEK
jgi:hypothetical protein